jgi:hypothetical protein
MNDGKGEQVFAGNVNEVLADKIVRHTARHSHVASVPPPHGRRGSRGHDTLLGVIVVGMALVMVAALVLLWDRRGERG